MVKKNEDTFFWHDYETFGTNTQLDGVSQFAGIRTNMELEEVGEPVDIYCKMTPDRLPSPMACMVTGVKPSEVQQKGLNETTFFHKVNKELGQAGTCGIGYNNIGFDDEVTRNGFYRNFIDPYRREWADGCSRWDLLNVVRMASALFPNIITVPKNEEGKKVFKLDQLSPANGIIHENAHEALSDVRATIALAKMIKDQQPEFWQSQFEQRNKMGVGNFLFERYDSRSQNNTLKFKPFLMADSFFGGDQDFIEVLYPIYAKGMNVYCIKLTQDISQLINLDAETLKVNLYKKREPIIEEGSDMLPSDRRAIERKIEKDKETGAIYLQEGELRVPLHTVKINQCPVIAPSNMLNKETAAALGIEGDKLRENIQLIKDNFVVIQQKVQAIFDKTEYPEADQDVDTMIYTGGFFSNTDKNHFEVVKKTNSVDLLDYLRQQMRQKKFDDKKRVPEMLFRYIARNFEQDMDMKAYQKWLEFCVDRITNKETHYSMTFEEYQEEIDYLKEKHYNDDFKLSVLEDLEKYAFDLKNKLGIN